MARSVCTGESWVERPLPPDKFKEVIDPAFEIDWYCSMFRVSPPKIVRQTVGTRIFHGSYNRKLEAVNFTKPLLGVVLHELAHHICHKQGLNGHGTHHGRNFGRVLQEMIDMVL